MLGAEEKIKYAIELNPQAEEVHYLYSFFLVTRGRFDEAIAEAKLALELDPLSLRLHQHLGTTFYYARRYDEAIERYQQTLQLDSDNASVREVLGDAFEQKGLREEALGEWQRAMVLGGDEELATLLRDHNARAGFAAAMRAVAQKKLERVCQRREQGGYVPTIELVRAHVRMHDQEKAFAALAKACAERNVFALLLKSDPFYDGLRTDRRFAAILKRNGLQ